MDRILRQAGKILDLKKEGVILGNGWVQDGRQKFALRDHMLHQPKFFQALPAVGAAGEDDFLLTSTLCKGYCMRSHASPPERMPGPARAGGFKADGFLPATRRMGIHHSKPPHKDGDA